MNPKELTLTLRTAVTPEDNEKVYALVKATGFFSDAEVEIAKELVQETLSRGAAAGYDFLFLENGKELIGYSCYGLIPGTLSSYDLYWIAVLPGHQGLGLGHWLLQETEQKVLASGGTRVYVDTSGRDQYESTRAFYQRSGYTLVANLKDFYAAGDDKVIFQKLLTETAEKHYPLPMTSSLDPNLHPATPQNKPSVMDH